MSDEYIEEAPQRQSLRQSLKPAAAAAVAEAPARQSLKPSSPAEEAAPAAAPAERPKSRRFKIRRGWSAGEQVIDMNSSYAKSFRPGKTTEIIKFLENEPYASYARHWVDRYSNGKKQTRTYTCLESIGEACPLCEVLAEKPQSVSSFNVAVIGDDGIPVLRSWDVGVKIFKTLKAYNEDPKVGPLTSGYFAVIKTGEKQQAQTNITPVRTSLLADSYGIHPVSDADLAALGKHDDSIVEVLSKGKLQALADELGESGDYA